MKKFISMIVCAAALVAVAQQPPPQSAPGSAPATPKVPYESSKAQLAYEKEKNLQLMAQNATTQYQAFMQDQQKKYADQEKALTDWMEAIRKDNGWDDTYSYDRDKDAWTHVPKPPVNPPATPPAAKPEPAKPEAPKAPVKK